MRGLPRARWIAGAAVLALGAVACGGGSSGSGGPSTGATGTTQPQGGTLRVYSAEPAYLLPAQTAETAGSAVLDALYSPLVYFDPKTGDPIPVVADGMPTSDDNKVWTIKVADGWTFDNGEPVTAQSFVDSWNYTAYGPNATNNSYYFGPGMADIVGFSDVQNGDDPDGDGAATPPPPAKNTMSGLVAVDDSTIQVTLNEPFSQFPLMLGYSGFLPMAKACIADIAKCNETPIGNGPFKMDGSWQHNVGINLVKSDTFNGPKKPNIDGINFVIYTDPATAYTDFQAGNLDYSAIPNESIAEARTTYADSMVDQPSSSFTYIGFPLYNPTFGGTVGTEAGGTNKVSTDVAAKADLRHALSMAINRQEIIDTIFDGSLTPADSLVSPVVSGYRKGACGEFCTYDVDKAKELYTQSGGIPSGTVNLWLNEGAGHETWMTAVGNYWNKAFGLNYKLQARPWAEYLDARSAQQVDGPFRLGWVMDYPSAQNYLAPIYGVGSGDHDFGYLNPAADALYAKGNAASSLEEGLADYNQAEDLILQDMPDIPMWFGRTLDVYGSNLNNVVVDKFGVIDYVNVSISS